MVGNNFDRSGPVPQQPRIPSASEATDGFPNVDDVEEPNKPRSTNGWRSLVDPSMPLLRDLDDEDLLGEVRSVLQSSYDIFEDGHDGLSSAQTGAMYLLGQALSACEEMDNRCIVKRAPSATYSASANSATTPHAPGGDRRAQARAIAQEFMPDDLPGGMNCKWRFCKR